MCHWVSYIGELLCPALLLFSQVNYLKEFGLSTESVCKLLAFKPQLMACSIEDRWKPLVKYLYYLGIKRDGMKRMLIIKPMVFCIDLETVIVPKVLHNSVGHTVTGITFNRLPSEMLMPVPSSFKNLIIYFFLFGFKMIMVDDQNCEIGCLLI